MYSHSNFLILSNILTFFFLNLCYCVPLIGARGGAVVKGLCYKSEGRWFDSTRFGGTYTKIGTIQRRLAWPLRRDDTQNREAFHIFGSQTLCDLCGTWQYTISCLQTSVSTELPWRTPPSVPIAGKPTPYHTLRPLYPLRANRRLTTPSALCTHCGQTDTLSHRLKEGGAGKEIWRWTQRHLTTMLRTHPCHIPEDWSLRPHLNLWPLQRHGAVLWVVAHFVFYRVQHTAMPTLQDFADFMRRARWKTHPLPQRRKRVGGYLIVLETAPLQSAYEPQTTLP